MFLMNFLCKHCQYLQEFVCKALCPTFLHFHTFSRSSHDDNVQNNTINHSVSGTNHWIFSQQRFFSSATSLLTGLGTADRLLGSIKKHQMWKNSQAPPGPLPVLHFEFVGLTWIPNDRKSESWGLNLNTPGIQQSWICSLFFNVPVKTLPNLGLVTSDKAQGATANFCVNHNHANPLPRVHTLLEHEIADVILQGLHLEAHSIPNTWRKMGLCQVRLCVDHWLVT